MNKTDFKNLVLKSFTSIEELRQNIKTIREELSKQNKETTKIYLDNTFNVLSDKKTAPAARFFALCSLKAVTENPLGIVMNELFSRSSAVKVLEEQAVFDKEKDASERGAKLLNAKPSKNDENIGKKYLTLLVEMIKYWDMKYGASEKGKDNAPRALFKKLSEKLKVPFSICSELSKL